jgi:hypothetical protein
MSIGRVNNINITDKENYLKIITDINNILKKIVISFRKIGINRTKKTGGERCNYPGS